MNALVLALPLLSGSNGASTVLEPDLAAVRALVEAALDGGAVGLSVAIAVGDELVLADGFGLAEVEHDVPAEVDTLFRIGSITKQFTAALIMQEVEQGTVELDQDMLDFLPDYPTGGRQVTIRNLLTHTSGIKSYTNLGPTWFRGVPLELSHQELLAMFKDEEFEFEPDDAFNYNNSGYYLLGMILEVTSERSYQELVIERIANPLELTHTRYDSNVDIIPKRAQGYRLIDGRLANDGLIGMSQPGAAGALLSTAADLVRWQRALVNGKAVARESYDQMAKPHLLTDNTSTNYGFGLMNSTVAGQRVVGHGGGINGFNSQLSYFPDFDLTVAVISNCENYSSGELADEVAQQVLRGLQQR